MKLVLHVPEGIAPPAEARVWSVDRTQPAGAPSRHLWHTVGGPRLLGLQLHPGRALPLRLGVPVGDATLWYTIPIGPAAGSVAAPPPPAKGGIPMSVQHDAMARLGAEWAAVARALDVARPDLAAAGPALRRARAWAALTPSFSLHRFEDAIGEFRTLAGDADRRLAELDATVRAGDAAAARARFREADAWACLRCHAKFRWGTVKDLSRFPDLTDPEPRR